MDRVAIALGSNLGDRAAQLDFAVSRLAAEIPDLKVSRYYETEPVDVPGPQPLFLNAAAVGTTSSPPADLLAMLSSLCGSATSKNCT